LCANCFAISNIFYKLKQQKDNLIAPGIGHLLQDISKHTMQPEQPEQPELQIRPMDVIALEFNSIVAALITRLEKKCKSENELALIDRMRKRVAVAKSVSTDFIIDGAIPFFMKHSAQILNESLVQREEYFSKMNPRKEYEDRYGEKPTAAQDFVFELADVIRNQYKKSSAAEKIIIYGDVRKLLNDCIEFKIARGDAE
jgi:hypothetical protein